LTVVFSPPYPLPPLQVFTREVLSFVEHHNNLTMKYIFYSTLLTFLFLNSTSTIFAATIYSAQSGDWNDPTSWSPAVVPSVTDDVIIEDGHTITKSGASYTHQGNITIHENAELISNAGNSSNGFTFDGGTFNVFGKLTLPFPDRDLDIIGNSLFIGHPSAVIFVSDDWEVYNQAEVVINGICIEVDDDFTISGKNTSVCGNGGVSIGNNASNNTFNLRGGATSDQVCLDTEVYRGVGGICETLITAGTGNAQPTAFDDFEITNINTSVPIDILFQDKPDSDPDATDLLEIVSVGADMSAIGDTSLQGGMIIINDNGTPNDPSDDFVNYTPPTDFVGVDTFYYTITDQNGGYSTALVTVTVSNPLPVTWSEFYGKALACEVALNWTTASELDNDYFEIEKSTNGRDFTLLGTVNGSGTTNNYQKYKFVDKLPAAENYYRIKQVDFDGKIDYSKVIVLKSNCIENEENIGIATLFPNPAKYNDAHLRFNARQTEETFLMVSDLFGSIIINQPLTVHSGINNVDLDITNWPVGTYTIWLGKQSKQLIKV